MSTSGVKQSSQQKRTWNEDALNHVEVPAIANVGGGANAHPISPASAGVPDVGLQASAGANRTMSKILKSYFYWTYTRGSFHYDVMVTLILAFIFITPFLWNYGDKPTSIAPNTQPVVIMGDGGHGLIVTVQASDVNVGAASSDAAIKKALKKAMEPVLGDSVFVERWELARDGNGNPQSWKVWAHR